VSSVVKAGLKGFNVHSDVLILAAKAGLLATSDPNTFTLDDLKRHNTLEHDASLSRSDVNLGDHLQFNATLFQTLEESNPGVDYYNTTSAGQVQKIRLEDSLKRNDKLINTRKEFIVRTRESALYLAVMGDVLTGQAPKEFVNIFFKEERLPIKEGWRRSPVLITHEKLNILMDPIAEASEWKPNVTQCASITMMLTENSTFTV